MYTYISPPPLPIVSSYDVSSMRVCVYMYIIVWAYMFINCLYEYLYIRLDNCTDIYACKQYADILEDPKCMEMQMCKTNGNLRHSDAGVDRRCKSA